MVKAQQHLALEGGRGRLCCLWNTAWIWSRLSQVFVFVISLSWGYCWSLTLQHCNFCGGARPSEMIVRSETEGIAKVPMEGRLEAMRTCAVQSVQLPLAVQHQQECLLCFCSAGSMSFTCTYRACWSQALSGLPFRRKVVGMSLSLCLILCKWFLTWCGVC